MRVEERTLTTLADVGDTGEQVFDALLALLCQPFFAPPLSRPCHDKGGHRWSSVPAGGRSARLPSATASPSGRFAAGATRASAPEPALINGRHYLPASTEPRWDGDRKATASDAHTALQT